MGASAGKWSRQIPIDVNVSPEVVTIESKGSCGAEGVYRLERPLTSAAYALNAIYRYNGSNLYLVRPADPLEVAVDAFPDWFLAIPTTETKGSITISGPGRYKKTPTDDPIAAYWINHVQQAPGYAMGEIAVNGYEGGLDELNLARVGVSLVDYIRTESRLRNNGTNE